MAFCQMWNYIRGPPLMQKTQLGFSYIHGSTNGSWSRPTWIILINESMKSKGDAKKNKIIYLGLVAVFFSFLLSLF